MRIDAGQHMRLGQQMKLAPRMIQSMEILQMPAAALEERIEQEMSSNPTLELREAGADPRELLEQREQDRRDAKEGERPLVVSDDKTDKSHADDFERLSNISEEYGDTWDANLSGGADIDHSPYLGSRRYSGDGERDAKMDAMANTAARPASLADQLLEQWHMVEASPAVRAAGEFLIGYIDNDGYLRTPRAQLLQQSPGGMTEADLDAALELLQLSLEPVGIGARDLRECLLLQIDAKLRAGDLPSTPAPTPRPAATSDNGDDLDDAAADFDDETADDQTPRREYGPLELERALVDEHLKDIEVNRIPKIAKALGVSVERVKQAMLGLRQFHPHPGRLLVDETPRSINPDAVIEYDEEQDCYTATLTKGRTPALYVSPRYAKMARDSGVDRRTREFVSNNIRSARWLIDAIQQRNATLLRVINVVIQAQRDYFDQGTQALRPLPMTTVADQLGIHVATVSRAVSEKYLQTPRGIVPLRMFFSGGTETEQGEAMSWQAVQAKLEELIRGEDKQNPLSDDQLVDELKKHGIDLARRTVAKYRKQLRIPTARQRREF